MTLDPSLDTELREYLRENRERNGNRHQEVMSAVQTVGNQVLALDSRVGKLEVRGEERHATILARLDGHAQRLDRVEEEAEITGVHELEKLRAELKRRDESTTWTRRWLLQVLGAIAATLAAAGVSWLVARAVYSPSHPTGIQPGQAAPSVAGKPVVQAKKP